MIRKSRLLQRSTPALVAAIAAWVALITVGGVAAATALQNAGLHALADTAVVATFVALAGGLLIIGIKAGG